MNKKMIATVAVALVCIAVTSVRAADGVPSSTLDKMGLSGLRVMSDAEGMDVRGKFAVAGGISIAAIGPIFDPPTAGSLNFYLAFGKYEASGANSSSASRTHTTIKQVTFSDGTTATETRIRSLTVSAAGSSSAKAF